MYIPPSTPFLSFSSNSHTRTGREPEPMGRGGCWVCFLPPFHPPTPTTTVPNDGMTSIHAYPINQFTVMLIGFSKRQNSIRQFYIVIFIIFYIIPNNISSTMAASQVICFINSTLSTSKIFYVRSCIAKEGKQTQKEMFV